MTNATEMTKLGMYQWLSAVKKADRKTPYLENSIEVFESALEGHLEALRQDRAALEQRAETQGQSIKTYQHNCMALTQERDTLRNRVQVLEMANATSGEVIRGLKEEARQARKNFMAARLAEVAASVSVPPYNASGEALDGNTDKIWKARWKEIDLMVEKHEAMKANHAEQLRQQKIMTAKWNAAFMSIGLMANHAVWSALAGADSKDTCMHSFHPAFPSGELCTFCGVGK